MEELQKPWRETSFFKHMKEVNYEGYLQMLEYEKAGGELDYLDKSAKEYFEKCNRKRLKNQGIKVEETEN